MSSNSFDIIVLGVGGMGSAACFELARRGHRVLGLEQFSLVHDRGSSHGQTRIIRTAYHEHPDYVPLLRRAFERWYELERIRGAHLLTECGCLAICAPVAREDWATITPGQIVLFTHFQRPSNGEPTVLRTHCGPLTVYDAQRGALYAEMMDAYYDVQGFAADDLQGMHVVERFIELPE